MYSVSYMIGDAIQWWELAQLNPVEFHTFGDFKTNLLNFFEPVNRELNARKALSEFKQMGKFNEIREYNNEFSKWVLQIPTMEDEEQVFHFLTGLKYKLAIDVERAEPKTLQEAMKVADRFARIYSNQSIFGWPNQGTGSKNGPEPMQIGNMNYRQSQNRNDN